MNRILTVAIALLLASVLLVSGCSAASAQVGKRAPDFQLSNLEGQPVSLSDFRGTPVLLNFWATWCGPCRQEMPLIQGIFEEQTNENLVILAVNIGENSAAVKNFMQSGNYSFPVLLDTDRNVALQYNARAIPTTFFIDKDGTIQVIKVGAFSNMIEIKKDLSKIIP